MKILTAILSLYIFFLAVQPALRAIDFSGKTEYYTNCCGNVCEKSQPKQQQDNSCNGICNPLLSCGTCVGFTFSFSPISLAPIPQVTEHTAVYISPAISEIALPIWQPPKIS